MAFELRRIRGSSVALILLGALLMNAGWVRHYIRPLTAKFQIDEALFDIGAFAAAFGLARIYRRKGSYDDFEGPVTVDEDDRWKKPGPGD